jgi:hypothetical protein
MERRGTRTLIWIALAVPLLMVAVYLSLIRSQGDYPPDMFTVPFVAGYMLAMVALLTVSLLRQVGPVARAALRGGAAAGLLVLGVVGAFSIGAPLLVAGITAMVGFGTSVDGTRWRPSLLAAAGAVVICVVVLVLGVDISHRVIVCPPGGNEGGGGAGIVLGSYQYQCVNGEVHWGSS